MALNTIEQLKQLLEQKNNILITFQKDAKNDAIASAAALSLFLEKLGKQVDIVCDEFVLPKTMQFLKKAQSIRPRFKHLQKFLVMVDIKDSGMNQITYDIKDEKLYVAITPHHGTITRDQVTLAQTDFTYDLIIVLDTQDLESLGGLYMNNTHLFYKTPIVNIDHNSANEHFGEVNVTDLTASSTAEILFGVMKKMGDEYIDAEIATALLTGMIAHTRSFKTTNVRPHTLVNASALMKMGGDRDLAIKHLYHTRSLPSLKLWGQALAHLQHDKRLGLVYTTITRDDFVRSGASEHDLEEIIEELISNSPEAKIILLLHEHPEAHGEQAIHGIVKTQHLLDAKLLVNSFMPKGDRHSAHFMVKGKSLLEAQQMVVDNIYKVIQVIQA